MMAPERLECVARLFPGVRGHLRGGTQAALAILSHTGEHESALHCVYFSMTYVYTDIVDRL